MPRTSPAARATLGAAAACVLLLGTATTATALTPSATTSTTATTVTSSATAVSTYTASTADRRMARMLTARATTTRFGTTFSGAVLDARSNATVWRKNGDLALKPASTNKLVTASNALTLFGPDARFTTLVRGGPIPGTVILEGSGDPSLSSANLDSLARASAATLLGQGITSVKVFVDDDAFPTPTLAYGWRSKDVPDSIAPVRAVVRDQRNNSDTSADAARYLGSRLTANGVAAIYSGRANAAATYPVLASTKGQSVSTLVSRMLLNSDNEIAESLHKLVSRSSGTAPPGTERAPAQAKQLAAQGLKAAALYDGSGLSRADRLSALQLTRIVDRGLDSRYADKLWPLQSAQAMPTAGRTGTLKYRFTTTASKCAVGRVWAKTGTLNDVVSLAGFTKGKDGRVKVFAFVVNGKSSTTTLKQNIDMLAATVNGCY